VNINTQKHFMHSRKPKQYNEQFNTILTSVRPIREFREMPITDINARMHPITITDTDMKVTAWQ